MKGKKDSPGRLALPHVRRLHGYTPGMQPEGEGWVKLNTNENPYPPSPRVGAAIRRELSRLRLYPNPASQPLREALARRHGLKPSQVIIGNGSDDILNLLARTFCAEEKPAGMAIPSYSLYPVLSAIQNSRIIGIPFRRDMVLPAGKIASCGANIFFLASPNAPTGVQPSRHEIEGVLKKFKGLLAVDEAYAAFAGESAVPLLSRYRRLVVTRTFSKSHGLAGLRVGYALADPEVIDLLDRTRDSYNVNRLSQAGALAAIEDQAYYDRVTGKIKAERGKFIEALRERGWFVYPSQANFVFTEPVPSRGRPGPAAARDCFEFLKARRVLVRYFGGNRLTDSFLRVTIGTAKDMRVLLNALDAWRNHEQPKSPAKPRKRKSPCG